MVEKSGDKYNYIVKEKENMRESGREGSTVDKYKYMYVERERERWLLPADPFMPIVCTTGGQQANICT